MSHRTRRILTTALVIALAAAAAEGRAGEAWEARAAQSARSAAKDLYVAFVRGDHAAFVNALYPGVVEAVGGREKMVAQLRSSIDDMRKNGMTLKSSTVDPPSRMVKVGRDGVQAILPTALIMGTPRGDMRTRSYLLGLSADGGKTWKFIDTGKLGREQLMKVVPELSPEIDVPVRPAPELLAK